MNINVAFCRGWFGTFLIHLINEHESFTNSKPILNYGHFNKEFISDEPVHMNLPGFQYIHKPVSHYIGSLPEDFPFITIEEFFNKFDNRVAFKSVPHQQEVYLENIEYTQFIMNHSKFIVCTWETNHSILERRIAKFTSDWKQHFTVQAYIAKRNSQAKQLAEVTDNMIIDMSKLLDTSDDEYKKLLEYIKAPALDNWKDIINEYKQTIKIV